MRCIKGMHDINDYPIVKLSNLVYISYLNTGTCRPMCFVNLGVVLWLIQKGAVCNKVLYANFKMLHKDWGIF